MNKRKKRLSKGQQRRLIRKRKWQKEDETFKEMSRVAPAFKAVLRMRGCELPFYDYLDSYSKQFQIIADSALEDHQSLSGIHETTDGDVLAYKKDGWEQLFFDIDKHGEEYNARNASANLRGSMTAFRGVEGQVFTLISVENPKDSDIVHPEYKYALKIAALTHEIGHVIDLESGANIDTDKLTIDVLEAEVFAHLYALNTMAAANLRQSYLMLKGALVEASEQSGLIAEISKVVLDRLPDDEIVDWNDFMDEPASEKELSELSPPLRRLIPN